MNQVMLSGRFTRDPEIRQTTNGKAVVSFTLAVQKDKEKADFINCVAWEKVAKTIVQYFKKGDPIIVFGRLDTRSYEKDGKRISVTEVGVRTVEFPMTKRDEPKEEPKTEWVDDDDSHLPF